ncbi:hypothetical protein Agabi119p4_1433 [Agaricus bisporus var. burnettii]|uniref:Uncharacterized protein n=1 Tax=Agaricus bisporus var. burnettii TaxID=192524 RepID=A0A8H7F9M7_AGABI|nr:hypothetical protein Agabi119p4_1433 [Agaricus bisporus var. burnettii]
MSSKIDRTEGALTKTVFSTPGTISDDTIDIARASVAFEFLDFVNNIRSIKSHDPILNLHPNIHYNFRNIVGRRNWLIHEYNTMLPLKWEEIADSVFHDVPIIEKEIIRALNANGVPIP